MAVSDSSSPEIIIPWSCLQDQASKPSSSKSPPAPSKLKSFADAVNNVCDVPLSQLPQPVVKGDRIAISIPEEEYVVGATTCKHNLHGRILWPKGTTPLKVGDLKAKLAPIWKTLGRWGVTSLGKGFYEFSFSSLEDVQSVRSVNSWNLNPGILKLFAWTNDFNPNIQQNSSAQVWIRIYGLAQEYWRPKILFAIASSVGTPICTDHHTNKPRFEREFGHFARVLVDMDLKKEPLYRVLVERIGFAFFVDFEFENRPEYCHFCNNIGHNQSYCKRVAPDLKKTDDSKAPQQPKKKEYRVVKDHQKESTDPVIEVVNLVHSPQKAVEVDPILEGLLRNYDGNNTPVEVDISSPVPVIVPNSPVTQVNDEPVLNSSSDSEFVDATQPEFNDVANNDSNNDDVANTSEFNDLHNSPIHNVSAENANSSVTPPRVVQDMTFLKNSWANLADLEAEDLTDNEVEVVVEPNATIPVEEKVDEPFQTVLKKRNRKKKPVANNTYSTRSKVGQPGDGS
jgi:hypothetical protein